MRTLFPEGAGVVGLDAEDEEDSVPTCPMHTCSVGCMDMQMPCQQPRPGQSRDSSAQHAGVLGKPQAYTVKTKEESSRMILEK